MLKDFDTREKRIIAIIKSVAPSIVEFSKIEGAPCKSTLYDIKSGLIVSDNQLYRIANACHVSPDYLKYWQTNDLISYVRNEILKLSSSLRDTASPNEAITVLKEIGEIVRCNIIILGL